MRRAAGVVHVVLVCQGAAVIILCGAFRRLEVNTTGVRIGSILANNRRLLNYFVAGSSSALRRVLFILSVFLINRFRDLFRVVRARSVIFFLCGLFDGSSALRRCVLRYPRRLTYGRGTARASATGLREVLSNVGLERGLSRRRGRRYGSCHGSGRLGPVNFEAGLRSSNGGVIRRRSGNSVRGIVNCRCNDRYAF